MEGHSPQPRPAPPLPPRDPAAGGREALGREAACQGKGAGGSNKNQRPAGLGGCVSAETPLLSVSLSPSLLIPTAGGRCWPRLGAETAARPGSSSPRPARPRRARPRGREQSRAEPGRPPRRSPCLPPSRETYRHPAQVLKITARGTAPARGFVFPLKYRQGKIAPVVKQRA